MVDKAVELSYLRNNFYRDNYRKVLVALLVMVIANVILALAAVHVIKNPPMPKYFATSNDGRITLLHPLSAPVLSVNSITEWATRAATCPVCRAPIATKEPDPTTAMQQRRLLVPLSSASSVASHGNHNVADATGGDWIRNPLFELHIAATER